ITLTPMRCSQFVHVTNEEKGFAHFITAQFTRLTGLYTKLLSGCLGYKWWVVLGALAVFVSSMGLATVVKKEMVPSTDQSVFIINLKLPVDYSIQHTDEVTLQCETILRERKEIKNLYVAVGGFGGNAANTALMFLTMKPMKERPVADPKEKIQPTGPLRWLS